MNKLDTALVTSALEEAGFSFTGSVKEADVVLINTCSVREHAEQDEYKLVWLLRLDVGNAA